jgi:hypothetical protein
MAHHVATRVVPLPRNEVEARLRDVPSWSAFLEGVGSIRYVSPERYVFTLNDGHEHRELKMVVRLRYRDHQFVWHGLGGAQGSVLRGSLRLEADDDHRTSVTLSMFSYPADFRSGVAELLLPHNTRVVADLELLERFLVGDGRPECVRHQARLGPTFSVSSDR